MARYLHLQPEERDHSGRWIGWLLVILLGFLFSHHLRYLLIEIVKTVHGSSRPSRNFQFSISFHRWKLGCDFAFLFKAEGRENLYKIRRIFSADTDTKFTDTVSVKNTATCRYFRAKHILLRFCVSLSCQIFGTKVLPNFNAKFKTLAPN